MKIRHLILCTILILSLLTGCQSSNVKHTTEDSGKATTATESRSNEFTWNLYVESGFYEDIYGQKFMDRVKDVISTIVNHEDKFTCDEDEDWSDLVTISRLLFPPLDEITSDFDINDEEVTIHYAMSKEEADEFLDEFKNNVEWWINEHVTLDGPDTLKALELYHYMSSNVTYDYEAIEDSDANVDVTPCRTIMEQEGICQSFAGAYAYLLLEMGIDASITGGLSEDGGAHEWTLLKLNDKWYYSDVTYENGNGGNGLEYFGMDAEKRSLEGNYPVESFNVGECNQLMGDDFPVDNTDLSDLWIISDVSDITCEDGVLIVTGTDDAGEEITVQIP